VHAGLLSLAEQAESTQNSFGCHLTIVQIFNAPYLLNEAAWYEAEGLHDPTRSPSLRSLTAWAVRYRCYVAGTLLEATPEGHIYNSLVLAAPGGGFVRPGGMIAASETSGSSAVLVRKHSAASLEGFVFRSASRPGRGGEPAAHVVEVDAAPLLKKRGIAGGGAALPSRLRLAFAICYENFLSSTMEAILVSS
jgi:hypothetical protein